MLLLIGPFPLAISLTNDPEDESELMAASESFSSTESSSRLINGSRCCSWFFELFEPLLVELAEFLEFESSTGLALDLLLEEDLDFLLLLLLLEISAGAATTIVGLCFLELLEEEPELAISPGDWIGLITEETSSLLPTLLLLEFFSEEEVFFFDFFSSL